MKKHDARDRLLALHGRAPPVVTSVVGCVQWSALRAGLLVVTSGVGCAAVVVVRGPHCHWHLGMTSGLAAETWGRNQASAPAARLDGLGKVHAETSSSHQEAENTTNTLLASRAAEMTPMPTAVRGVMLYPARRHIGHGNDFEPPEDESFAPPSYEEASSSTI